MPVSYPTDHDEGEERELLIDELCKQDDPRAAEVLIAIMCDGGMMGQIMFDTLEEIGPPAVPYSCLIWKGRIRRDQTGFILVWKYLTL